MLLLPAAITLNWQTYRLACKAYYYAYKCWRPFNLLFLRLLHFLHVFSNVVHTCEILLLCIHM